MLTGFQILFFSFLHFTPFRSFCRYVSFLFFLSTPNSHFSKINSNYITNCVEKCFWFSYSTKVSKSISFFVVYFEWCNDVNILSMFCLWLAGLWVKFYLESIPMSYGYLLIFVVILKQDVKVIWRSLRCASEIFNSCEAVSWGELYRVSLVFYISMILNCIGVLSLRSFYLFCLKSLRIC